MKRRIAGRPARLIMIAVLCAFLAFLGPHQTVFASGSKEADNLNPVAGRDVHDGAYAVRTESENGVIPVESCILIVTEGEMEAKLTLSGDCIKLYPGTAKEAPLADEASLLTCAEDENGDWVCTFPAEFLNQPLDCAVYSAGTQEWADDRICFLADSMPKGALKSTASRAYQTGEVPKVGLKNGRYTVRFTMTGGTGKAYIESPAVMEVKDQSAIVTLVWSSEHYDYMVVNGEKYLPVNESGNSVFEVPLMALDEPFPVIADTTAMSEPHEIEYALTFDSAAIEQIKGGNRGAVVITVIVLIAAACAVTMIRKMKHKN